MRLDAAEALTGTDNGLLQRPANHATATTPVPEATAWTLERPKRSHGLPWIENPP